MDSKIINMSLPTELVERLDKQARLEFSTRSEYIKRAIIAQLKTQHAFDPETPPEDAEATLKKLNREKLRRFLETIPVNELNFDD